MTQNIWETEAIMECLREDIRRQILAIEKAEHDAGGATDPEFCALLNDRNAYPLYFRDHIWFALPPEERIVYLEKYAKADDIERPFIASGILDRLGELVIAADEYLQSHQGRSGFLN